MNGRIYKRNKYIYQEVNKLPKHKLRDTKKMSTKFKDIIQQQFEFSKNTGWFIIIDRPTLFKEYIYTYYYMIKENNRSWHKKLRTRTKRTVRNYNSVIKTDLMTNKLVFYWTFQRHI